MKARRNVVVLVGGALGGPERTELERAGATIIDTEGRDPALTARHLACALMNPMPIPTTSSPLLAPVESTRRPVREDDGQASGGIRCSRCGTLARLVAGKGPHVARANCDCGAWRWVSRLDLDRAGIDAASLAKPEARQPSLY